MSVGVYFKKLKPEAKQPEYAHPGDSGADLFAAVDCEIAPRETFGISTGIAIQLPPGYEAQVRTKSGIALKRSCSVLNSPGTIDNEYRGEIVVIMHNHGSDTQGFAVGDKIAQLIVSPIVQASFLEQDELTDTVRGTGGFGSTGK